MHVIPNVIDEATLGVMCADDFGAFCGVMDDYIASYFKNYLVNPQANPEVVGKVKKYLGSTIRRLTAHLDLQRAELKEAVATLNLVKVANENSCALGKLYDNLKEINDVLPHALVSIEPRSKDKFDYFLKVITECYNRIPIEDRELNDVPDRVMANRDLFYMPREKTRYTCARTALKRTQDIVIAIKGIEYKRYCDENNIVGYVRRVF